MVKPLTGRHASHVHFRAEPVTIILLRELQAGVILLGHVLAGHALKEVVLYHMLYYPPVQTLQQRKNVLPCYVNLAGQPCSGSFG